MWFALGLLALGFIAWCSGEHHAERAKRIVENNRVERRKKWREQERLLRHLEEKIKLQERLIRKLNNDIRKKQ